MDRVAALYRKHIEFVCRTLWRRHAPWADIKDIAQEVFITVLRKVRDEDPRFKTEDKERGWLYTITIYELKNYRARARYRRTEPMDESTQDYPEPRNDYARIADGEILLLLLASIKGQGRAVFELVDLEGFSVVDAAQTLNISESTAHNRLGLARKDVEAAVAKLTPRGEASKSAFLMPFGAGAWLQLRDLQNPPEGVTEEIWERLQATVAELDRQDERHATPPPQKLPPRLRAGRLMMKLLEHLKSPFDHLFSFYLGGAIVALLFLLWPKAQLVPFRDPVPVFIATSSPSTPAPLPASSSTSAPTDAPPTADTSPTADATLDEETHLIRRARAAFAVNDRPRAIEALTDYERRFPAGRLANAARTLRKSLHDAARK